MPQFLDHLTDDVLPALLDGLSAEKSEARVFAVSPRFPSQGTVIVGCHQCYQ